MTHGGFNPFRDGHGRFADRPSGGGGSRATLSAPLPAKTEWSNGGVTVEFSGGKSPSYRVLHGDQLVKEFPATSKWRQDLAAATAHAQDYLVTMQRDQVNASVRAEAARQRQPEAAPAVGPLAEFVGKARTLGTPEAYQTVGTYMLATIHATPAGAAAKAEFVAAQVEMTAIAKLPASPARTRAAGNAGERLRGAQYRYDDLLRREALDMLEAHRPQARAEDVKRRVTDQRVSDLVDEVIAFFPAAWVQAASARSTLGMHDSMGVRSNYAPERSSIMIERGAGRATVAHELGHWLENHIPALRRAAIDYRESRTKGQQLQSLSIGNARYEAHELTLADRFSNAYMGKVYASGDTEIISMMIQDLTDGQYATASKDPKMFSWFIGVLATI